MPLQRAGVRVRAGAGNNPACAEPSPPPNVVGALPAAAPPPPPPNGPAQWGCGCWHEHKHDHADHTRAGARPRAGGRAGSPPSVPAAAVPKPAAAGCAAPNAPGAPLPAAPKPVPLPAAPKPVPAGVLLAAAAKPVPAGVALPAAPKPVPLPAAPKPVPVGAVLAAPPNWKLGVEPAAPAAGAPPAIGKDGGACVVGVGGAGAWWVMTHEAWSAPHCMHGPCVQQASSCLPRAHRQRQAWHWRWWPGWPVPGLQTCLRGASDAAEGACGWSGRGRRVRAPA
jgi:hypothetical protein